MAKLPGMFKVTGKKIEGNKLIVNYYVRWWHPSAWLMMWRWQQPHSLTVWQRITLFGFLAKLVITSFFKTDKSPSQP